MSRSKKSILGRASRNFERLFSLGRIVGFGAAATTCAAAYIGCGTGFIGKNTKKPSPENKRSQTISPDEIESPRSSNDAATPAPNTSIVASGQGTVSGGPSISLSVIQTASESWWKNCLYAKTKQSESWVPVSCNKPTKGFPTTKPVVLAATEKTCNMIEIKVETYKNLGETCNERKKRGLHCEGPYAQTPDTTRFPAPGKNNNFRVYDSKTVSNPDPLIFANANWALPNFLELQTEMTAFRRLTEKNQWVRLFFEDKPETSISAAIAAATTSEAKALGVDFNDYVFDVKSQNVDFSIEGYPSSCRQ